jgi:uncharacterized protein (TIGR00661 family)
MKYLFIVQGEGRGHLTQAMTMEKLLLNHGHQVVGILVGRSPIRKLPEFFEKGVSSPISFFDSFNFVPSFKNKRPSVFRTVIYNLIHAAEFFPSIRFVTKTIKETNPDVIINFYELIGSFGYLFSRTKAPEVCIGHQYLLLHKDFNIPEFGYEGHLALNLYSKMTSMGATERLALSFRSMPDDLKHRIKVVPPLLRPEVLAYSRDGIGDQRIVDGDYILGYMLNSGFAHDVMHWHYDHPTTQLRFFWDKHDAGPVKEYDDTLTFYYLDDKEFLHQMAGCKAYASTAGFESICEAMYMGKPLMMVPSHIEQKCNAFDATRFNAAVEAQEFDLSILLDFADNGFSKDEKFPEWALSAQEVFINALERLSSKR